MSRSDNTSVLDNLAKYLSNSLRTGSLDLDKSQSDGRLNSQMNERQISTALQLYSHANDQFQEAGLSIEIAPPRYWYDFAIRGEKTFLPVNVKVSTLEGNDNLSSKEGVFYALTGVDPKKVKINDWERYCEAIGNHLGELPEADYYFLVINKNKAGDVFWTSLKRLPVLTPNGNNPPFQCNWSKNRCHSGLDEIAAQQYILGVLRQTFVLRAKALESFDQHISLEAKS